MMITMPGLKTRPPKVLANPVTLLLGLVLTSACWTSAYWTGASARGLSPQNPQGVGRLEWAPVRADVSADRQHGFTFGFMTLHKTDGTTVTLKYLAYWVKREGRWLVAAYKRRLRPAGDVGTALLAPVLPTQLVPASTGSEVIAHHSQSLIAAEQAFSDEAQRIGQQPSLLVG